ncbi:N-acetylmuramoyl-L-alanine amidase [Paenibacillus sp. TAB 01]|uniref:peptidoglycan recognition protein family protein n=1 Tax=Paenibacillus sp. TAB 01 TaxID=3368988 RepID=UPI00375385EA
MKYEIQFKYIEGLPKKSYRNGKPEGIVMHETDNEKSTIWNEIAFMSRNFLNAFVNAFADKDNIVEIADPRYICYGAGAVANRFLMGIELCHHKTKADFEASFDRWCFYAAAKLVQFDLPVIDAEKTGKGTLWSHAAVSKHLGGTTHDDPHDYLARFGYNWSMVVDRVTKYWNELKGVKTENSLPTGKVYAYEVYQSKSVGFSTSTYLSGFNDYYAAVDFCRRWDSAFVKEHNTGKTVFGPTPAIKPAIDVSKYPTLRKGSTGQYVKTLQKALGGLVVDGSYGSLTDTAVRAFQKKNGLTEDGIVGPKTWDKVING